MQQLPGCQAVGLCLWDTGSTFSSFPSLWTQNTPMCPDIYGKAGASLARAEMSAEAPRAQAGSPCRDLLLSMAPQGHPGLTCQIRAAKLAQARDFLLFPSTTSLQPGLLSHNPSHWLANGSQTDNWGDPHSLLGFC